MNVDAQKERAYAEALASHGGSVYRMAYAIVRSRADADDVFQEVFLRYLRAAPSFVSCEHQRAWLLRVAANCAKSLVSSPWRRKRAPLTEEIPAFSSEETGLNDALGRLSPLYREVVHLYYYEGYQAEEIAGLLKRKPGTVRTQLVRARETLRRYMEQEADHGD